jgi:hypothetical protein
MAITTLDGYIGATKQQVVYNKTASQTAVASVPFSVFNLAGNPGAGTIAVGNTANGVVPTDATAGYSTINAFGGGATGYVSGIEYSSSVLCTLGLFDTVFSCGAYAFNANTTLGSQPSYASRVPTYVGTRLFIEAATAFTGNQTIQINYLDQDGNAGDTGAIATSVAPILGRMYEVPLAAGDNGVSQIVQVRSTVSTVGTFNVHVLRPIWQNRIILANYSGKDDFLKTGMPVIYADSALRLIVWADSTATGLPRTTIEIANG